MKKWLPAMALLFVGALLLAPAVAAQEQEEPAPTSPTLSTTINVERAPGQILRLQAKRGVIPGPNLDEGEDEPNYNDPTDPVHTEGAMSANPSWYQVSNPTTSGLTTSVGGGIQSAGRPAAQASSPQQEARRSIKKLIKQLED